LCCLISPWIPRTTVNNLTRSCVIVGSLDILGKARVLALLVSNNLSLLFGLGGFSVGLSAASLIECSLHLLRN